MRVKSWAVLCVGLGTHAFGEFTTTVSLSNHPGLEPPIPVDTIHPDAVVDLEGDDDAGSNHDGEKSKGNGKLGMIGKFQNNNIKKGSKPNKKIHRAFEAFRFRKSAPLEETMVGTRLVSGSFHLISVTVGMAATAIKVSGDAAATIMGSSVKVVGTAVKSVGAGLNRVSQQLEPKVKESYATDEQCPDNEAVSKNSTSISSRSRLFLPRRRRRQKKPKERSNSRKFVKRTQTVASKGIRIVGNVMSGMGETLVMAGVAAEFVATSTANVAEATVRIVEDLTGTISMVISLSGEQRKRRKNQGNTISEAKQKLFMPSFLSLGIDPEDNSISVQAKRSMLLEKFQEQWMKEPSLYHSLELLEMLASEVTDFGRNVSADVQGVSSMASELAAALLLCYLVAVLVLYCGPSKTVNDSDKGDQKPLNTGDQKGELLVQKYNAESLYSSILMDCPGFKPTSITQVICCTLHWCLHVSVKVSCVLLHSSVKLIFRVIWSRPMFLLLFNGLIWLYLSGQYQNRALTVQR
jgi:hypothetical protein